MNCFKQTVVCVTCGACQDSLVLYAFAAAAALRHFSLDQMRINTAGLFQTSFETTQKPPSFVPITLPLRLSFVSVVFVLSTSYNALSPSEFAIRLSVEFRAQNQICLVVHLGDVIIRFCACIEG